MALGLPVILFTAFVHRGAHQAMTMAQLTPGGSSPAQSTMTRIAVKASPWVSWRRTTIGGLAALGAFMLLVGAYMVSRVLGIGPAASLMASGVLGASERILVSDFKSPASDTTLGPVVTEAFRSDLAQSQNLTIVQPTAVRETLRRMQRPVDSRVDFTLAREVATREGIKAVVDGEVLALGGGYVIAAKLYAAQSGEVLATFRVTAEQGKDIIGAIDKLSREVRSKVGESLKSVNAAPALEQVTTPSLEALKKYVQGVRVFREGGDFEKGVALLEEAIALDTGFAMAYRKLATELSNNGGFASRQNAMIQKAYDHRDRLSDAERYLTIGTYFGNGPNADPQKALAAFEALIEIQPKNSTALNNAANTYNTLRQHAKAEQYAQRAVDANPTGNPYFSNLYFAQLSQGKTEAAERTLAEFVKHIPTSPSPVLFSAALAASRGRFDSAVAILTSLRDKTDDRGIKGLTTSSLADLARLRGRLKDAARLADEADAISVQQGVAAAPLRAAVRQSITDSWFLGDPTRAAATMDAALQVHPLAKLDVADRPYGMVVRGYAFAGRVDRAKATLAAFDQARPSPNWFDALDRVWMTGDIAMAERRYDDAVRAYRDADKAGCQACSQPDIGRAYDLAGKSDSAIAVLTRYIEQFPDAFRLGSDAWNLAGVHKRLGELYEAKGDKQKAAGHYVKFLELWKNADPELQPKVDEVRKRLARISDTEKR